jgi:hypothetical protein
VEEKRAELAFEERENGDFVLSKTPPSGPQQELVLSEMEVMFLARLVPSFARQLSANKSRADQGISALVAVPVVDYSIGNDLHQQVVILRLSDEAEQVFDFSFDPARATNIGSALIDWADKVRNVPPAFRQ